MSAAYFREYRAKRAAVRDAAAGLMPFQSAFVAAVCRQRRDPPDIAALSLAEGQRKVMVVRSHWWRGHSRRAIPSMKPCCRERLGQRRHAIKAAIVLEFARAALGESDGYRWSKDAAIHKSESDAGEGYRVE